MSWLEKLYSTYESSLQMGRERDWPLEQQVMAICHTNQNAHINITIDGAGNLLAAEVLEKTQIVLPATEQSAGRSSGEAAHALADKIQYVAADYGQFGGLKKPYFASYQQQLADWCASDHSHKAAAAVLAYVSKQQVVADLVARGVLHAKEGVLLTRWTEESDPPEIFKVLPKEKGQLDQGSALVCWTVQFDGDKQDKTWLDPSLQQAWVDYDCTRDGTVGLCYVTGKQASLAVNHPAKIRHSGDKAKLISSNDSSGFTFRGRFLTGDQANGVSFEVTSKAHNALRWLLGRQNMRTGDQIYISWAVNCAPVPSVELDFWAEDRENFDITQENFGADLGQGYNHRLQHYMAGYLQKSTLSAEDNVMVMGIDSATPGRMGIIYYRETQAGEFITTLTRWHQDLAWPQRLKIMVKETDRSTNGKKSAKQAIKSSTDKVHEKMVWATCAPAPFKLIDAVYGDVIKSTETLKKNLVNRLLPCIVEGRPIPLDIVNYSIRRATNRVAYSSDQTWLWEQNLGIACALYKGFCKRSIDKQKEYKMALEQEYASRDYLYGRLLAIAEKIEAVALYLAGEKRMTTAERYMQQFADRPFHTWRNIENALKPYQQRLSNKYGGLEVGYKKLLDEVMSLFNVEDFKQDKRLSGEFLLGYHCQRLWLDSHKRVEGQWVASVTRSDNPDEDQTNA